MNHGVYCTIALKLEEGWCEIGAKRRTAKFQVTTGNGEQRMLTLFFVLCVSDKGRKKERHRERGDFMESNNISEKATFTCRKMV